MPECPKPPRRPKKQGKGLSRNSEIKRTKTLEGGKPLRQVSQKREAWLEENNLPLSTFGRPIGKDRLQKQGMRWFRSRKPWTTVRRLTAATSRKLRKVLAKIGPRGRRIEAALRPWRDAVWERWGACPITGATRESRTAHCHHCYDRATDPDWIAEPWNGIPLRWDVHQFVDHSPELHQALQFVADMVRAADAEKRKPLTRAEFLSIILERAPKVRKYVSWEAS